MANVHYDFEEGYKPQALRQFFKLKVVLGMVVLLAVNAVLLLCSPLANVDPDNLPAAHTWVWWATQEFLAQQKPPDVVLLGSSLVMHPVSRQEANFLGKDIDYVKHHRSNYMENLLAKRGLPGAVCYNFALPGGMVSDDYMVARALLRQRKPAVMVLGLSIRDFIDNGVHCAGSTPAFKYLKRFTPIDDLVDISMPQIWQRFDYLCGKWLYLWGKKLDLQVLLAEQTKAIVGPFYAKYFAPSQLAKADPSRSLPSNLRAEVEEGMMIVQHDMPYSFEDNSAEYRKRYRSPNASGVSVQNYFFKRLLELAQKENIQVVLVNMPLTPANHKLMPPGSYEQYMDTLRRASAEFGYPLIDLDGGNAFALADYYDTSHMNASGGKKLVNLLVDALVEQPQMVAAIKRGSSNAVANNGKQL
jgi:hypothetical protein